METPRAMCAANSTHFLFTPRLSAIVPAQTHRGRRGAARQGNRLGKPKHTRVIPYAFSLLWKYTTVLSGREIVSTSAKAQDTLRSLVAKIVQILYRNSCKPKGSGEHMSWRGKFYSTFWGSLCCLELTSGNDTGRPIFRDGIVKLDNKQTIRPTFHLFSQDWVGKGQFLSS